MADRAEELSPRRFHPRAISDKLRESVAADLRIEDFPIAGAHVVDVAGQVDLFAAPQLEARTAEVIRAQNKFVIVDLSQVSFIDSTGLSVLIATLKRIRAARGELALVVTNYDIERLLELTGLDATFSIHRSRDEALAQMSPLSRLSQPAGVRRSASAPR